MKLIAMLLFSAFMGTTALSIQILSPAHWQYEGPKKTLDIGDEVDLIFTVKLDETWHLYSNHQNYSMGPLPTTFEFISNSEYRLVGTMQPIGAKKTYDSIFEVDVNYFENTAKFRQRVKILDLNPIIKGVYNYQVCSVMDGKCILGEGDFEFHIKTNK